ncbi:MAG: SIMPL domain-containing protein [Arachnia sp.]
MLTIPDETLPIADIVVTGTAQTRAMPDRATLSLTVSAEDAKRSDAYSAATTLATAVDTTLKAHSTDTDRVVTAALIVQPITRWRRGERQRTGWRATRHTRVELTGLDAVGKLVAELARAGAEVEGPSWSVAPDHPAHTEVRKAAAADARARAEAYAHGLGIGLGRALWLAEPGLGRRPSRPGMQPGSARGLPVPAPSSAPAEDAIIEVVPEELVLSASVEAAFALADGPH